MCVWGGWGGSGSSDRSVQPPAVNDNDGGDADIESEVDSIIAESSDLDMIMSTPLHELNSKLQNIQSPACTLWGWI